MPNGIKVPNDRFACVYRENISDLSISTAWGYLYIATQTFTISNAGDLTQKDIIAMFECNASTCWLSIDRIQSNSVQITFVRATPTTVSGTIKIYVLDK